MADLANFSLDYRSAAFKTSLALHADCFEWLGRIQPESIHAIVTDPPYGVKEYNFDQIEKRTNGNGGVWRIPPSFDGSNRAPLPRFTRPPCRSAGGSARRRSSGAAAARRWGSV